MAVYFSVSKIDYTTCFLVESRILFNNSIQILPGIPWFLYKMVAHFSMRTHGLHQALRFVEGIWLHRKSRQLRFHFSEKDLVFFIRATLNEQPSYITMALLMVVYHMVAPSPK